MGEHSTEWRIVDLAPAYEVSEHGLLRRRFWSPTRRAGHMPTGSIKGGYRSYKIVTPRGKEMHWAHRLVALAFIGPPPSPTHVIAHGDGNRLNNHYTNLRWATLAENAQDTALHGSLKGVKNGRCKVSEDDVRHARALHHGGVRIAVIARKIGLTWSSTSSAIQGKNWGWLDA